MKKALIYFSLLVSMIGIFSSCGDDNKIVKKYEVTIASVERLKFNSDHFSPYYAKYKGSDQWKTFPYIHDFQHNEGYEYVICVKEVYDKSKEDMLGGSPYSFYLLETISASKKDSEDIPLQQVWINVASKKSGDEKYPYSVFDSSTGNWVKWPPIEGFEYEEGYEYGIIVDCKYNGVNALNKYSYTYVKTAKKEKVESNGKPL